MQAKAKISIERGGISAPSQMVPSGAVVEALLALRGGRDATFEVAPEGRDSRILIAVDGTDAVVGLVEPDAVYELSDPKRAGGPARRFIIGGQETSIASEFSVRLDHAAKVVEAWLEGDGSPPVGRWVRR